MKKTKKQRKILISISLVLVLFLTLMPQAKVSATEDKTVTSMYAVVKNGTIGTVNWSLDTDGVLTFGGGVFPDNFDWASWGNNFRSSVNTVTFSAPIIAGNKLDSMFYLYGNLKTINGLNQLDTSNTVSVSRMFQGCSKLTTLDVSRFNTSKVTSMYSMFYDCASITDFNLQSFDTQKVLDMNAMFSGCSRLTSLDLSSFDTGNVKTMRNMFQYCPQLQSIEISSFNTQNVTDMSSMFNGCRSLKNLDVSHFDTGNVTNMDVMFQDCFALTSLNIRGFDTKTLASMTNMFKNSLIQQLTLGSRFQFKYLNHNLNQPLNDRQYTGLWQAVGTGTISNPNGEILSQEQLLAFDGTNPQTFVWQPRIGFLLQYNLNGAEGTPPPSEMIPFGYTAIKHPTNPNRTGYTFNGWNLLEDGSGINWHFTLSTMPNHNVTLYAQWTPNQYEVSYDLNGGEGIAPINEIVHYGTLLSKPANPVRTGYTFTGWNVNKDIITTWDWDFATKTMDAGDMTLYAQWRINDYQVKYDLNGASGVVPDSENIMYQEMITAPFEVGRAGHTFLNWNTQVDGSGVNWDFNTMKMPANDLTLYAQWSVNSYEISYDLNGGEGEPPRSEIVNYGMSITKPMQPVREGYVFTGWCTTRSDIPWNFETMTMPDYDEVLHAQWAAKRIQVTIHSPTVKYIINMIPSDTDLIQKYGIEVGYQEIQLEQYDILTPDQYIIELDRSKVDYSKVGKYEVTIKVVDKKTQEESIQKVEYIVYQNEKPNDKEKTELVAKTEIPHTGDNNNVIFMFSLLITSFMIGIIVYIKRKKNDKK